MAHVLFVRLYLQLFVGGLMSCLFVFTSSSNKTSALLQTTGGKDEQIKHEPSYKQLEVKTNKQYMSHPTNNWRWRRTNKTWALLQTTGGKDKQTRHEPSYKQLEVKTNKQDMSPPTNNWRWRRKNKTWALLQTTGGEDQQTRHCLFVFTSSCL
jgi:hypothetical protein